MVQIDRKLKNYTKWKDKDLSLKMIASEMNAVKSYLGSKAWVLKQQHKLQQAQIDVIEQKYKLDFYKYNTLAYEYAVIKNTTPETATTIINRYPLNLLHAAIKIELCDKEYNKILDEVEELLSIPEVIDYNNYFRVH